MKVETEGLLSIGRFAFLTGLTVKALRHYDEIGLLRPMHVDGWTGYRWYGLEQARVADAIRRLRELEIPLDETRSSSTRSPRPCESGSASTARASRDGRPQRSGSSRSSTA